MLPNRLDALRVRAADGLASAADRAELAAAGVDASALVEEWGGIRSLLRASLDSGAAPELADGVLAALELSDGLSGGLVAESLSDEAAPDIADAVLDQLGLGSEIAALLVESLDGGPAPELADGVLSALELDGADLSREVAAALSAGAAPDIADDVLSSIGAQTGLSGLVSEALDAGEAPDLTDSILTELGLSDSLSGLVSEALDAGEAPDLWSDIATQLDGTTDAGDLLREAMAASAGEIDIADAVMAELGLEAAAPAAAAAGAEVVPLFGGRSALMGTVLAIAAAMLLYIVPGAPVGDTVEPTGDSYAYNIQDNNEVEIEELESSPDAMVQIFQTEEGAPTIIFIDEMEDMGAESAEGVPL